MAPVSAGILLYRSNRGATEVLLVHPGGPFWQNKDEGAWMIPKGLVEAGEDAATAALREFEEELGNRPSGIPRHLCKIKQAGGKWVEVFTLEGDFDVKRIVSNAFDLEWPPGSGRFVSFPEVDRAGWFSLEEAGEKILPSQRLILDALRKRAS